MPKMNANDILLYENPYMPTANPRRHRKHHKRNPNIMGEIKSSFAGLQLTEMAAAVGGFALCAMVPGYIIKPAAATPGVLTTTQKALKVAMAVGFAVVAKVALNRMNRGIANAAMYGGIAGAGALALKIYAPSDWPSVINSGPRAIASPGVSRPLATPPMMGRDTYQEFVPANQL
jgi:hypothetical protein